MKKSFITLGPGRDCNFSVFLDSKKITVIYLKFENESFFVHQFQAELQTV